MSNDINVGQLSEAINNKTDRDAGNLSNEGKSLIVGLGMPDYTAGVSVTLLTAISSRGLCWGYVSGSNSNAELKLTRGSTIIRVVMAHGNNANGACGFFPVEVGDIISAENQTGTEVVLYPYKGG